MHDSTYNRRVSDRPNEESISSGNSRTVLSSVLTAAVFERGVGLKNLALKASYGRRQQEHARFVTPSPRSPTFDRGRRALT